MSASVIQGDCLDVLPLFAMAGEQFDSCITDPPYGLGFMGKHWDAAENVAFRPETWRAVYDVLKPGAYLLAFGGTRTFHRMACAIEDAGFDIRDSVMWLYGTGFPKSHDVSKGIDKAAGSTREVLASGRPVKRMIPGADQGATGSWVKDNGREYVPTETAPATPEAAEWQGWGTALKPAWEPIILARKPLIGTVAQNVLAHRTGALNIDASRIPADDKTPAPVGAYGGSTIGPAGHSGVRDGSADSLGRWPANVILSYPEDEYLLRPDVTQEQRRELFGWLHANA